jgi:hypothetical protein
VRLRDYSFPRRCRSQSRSSETLHDVTDNMPATWICKVIQFPGQYSNRVQLRAWSWGTSIHLNFFYLIIICHLLLCLPSGSLSRRPPPQMLYVFLVCPTRGSSVSTVTRLRRYDRSSIPGRGSEEVSFSSSRPDRLWGPPSLLSNGLNGLLPAG